MVDDHPPSTYAPSGAFPTFGLRASNTMWATQSLIVLEALNPLAAARHGRT